MEKCKFAIFESEFFDIPAMTKLENVTDEKILRVFEADDFSEAIIRSPEIFEYAKENCCVIGLIVKPFEEPIYTAISTRLRRMQSVVDGNIESIVCPDLPDLSLIVNEEGKLLKFPLNRGIYYKEKLCDILAGNIIIMSVDRNGIYSHMTEKQLIEAYNYFENPEIYLFDKYENNIFPIKLSAKVARIMKRNNISIIS